MNLIEGLFNREGIKVIIQAPQEMMERAYAGGWQAGFGWGLAAGIVGTLAVLAVAKWWRGE